MPARRVQPGSGVRDDDKFMVRLPDGMRDRLKAEAQSNGRSMNSELVARVQRTFELDEARADLEARFEEARRTGRSDPPGYIGDVPPPESMADYGVPEGATESIEPLSRAIAEETNKAVIRVLKRFRKLEK